MKSVRPERSSNAKNWVVNQFNSSEEAGKYADFQRDRFKSCELYSDFDAGGSTAVSMLAKTENGAQGTVMIVKGDITLSFTTTDDSEDAVKRQAKSMVPILQRHLEAITPKS